MTSAIEEALGPKPRKNRKAAPRLRLRDRLRIIKYWNKHPELGPSAIADLFGITRSQARWILKLEQEGKLQSEIPGMRRRSVSTIQLKKMTKELDLDQALEEQLRMCLAELSTVSSMPMLERIDRLSQLMQVRKTLLQTKLQSHLRRIDADVIATIIRKYDPEASDEDVVKIYRAAIEELKAMQS